MNRFTVFLFSCLLSSCFAYQTLFVDPNYAYEVYEPQDEIPLLELNEGRALHYEAFLNPNLHQGIRLQDMRIDESHFASYEEFLWDRIQSDFATYRFPGESRHFYLQVKSLKEGRIVGICAVSKKAAGSYFINHLGVHKDFRGQGIGSQLITQLIQMSDCDRISLDTRVFNKPAQAFYEKLGFQKLAFHPDPKKQTTYFYYVLSLD